MTLPDAPLDLPPGWTALGHAVVASTNDEAKALAEAGAPHGTIVWAERQQAGRGRRGRPWHSPAGNLYASVVLHPRGGASGQLAFVVAVAMAEAIAGLAPDAAVALKWPNDILAGGRKLAGILLESTGALPGRPGWVVAGTGVNLVAGPPESEFPATTLARESAAAVRPLDLLAAYARRLDDWFERWQAEGFGPLRAAWLARAAGLDGSVTVRLDRETFSGRYVGLDENGALLLRTAGDTLRRVAAGETFFGPA